jgi:hypothetical protein
VGCTSARRVTHADRERRGSARRVRRAAWFEAQLAAYALAERERTGGKRTSVKLPSATVGTRAGSRQVQIADAERLLAWAKAHRDDLVKRDETVLVSALRSAVDVVPCPDCGGTGVVLALVEPPGGDEPCERCNGEGTVVVTVDADGVQLDVPAVSVETGETTASVKT